MYDGTTQLHNYNFEIRKFARSAPPLLIESRVGRFGRACVLLW